MCVLCLAHFVSYLNLDRNCFCELYAAIKMQQKALCSHAHTLELTHTKATTIITTSTRSKCVKFVLLIGNGGYGFHIQSTHINTLKVATTAPRSLHGHYILFDVFEDGGAGNE